MEIEKAINYDKAYRDLANLRMTDEHFRHVLSDALRDQQKRQEGCEYYQPCGWCSNFDKPCDAVCGRRLKEAQEDER